MKTRKTKSRRSLQRLVRCMWADYDPMADRSSKVVVYNSKADQRANRPDLVPIPVMVVHRDLWRRLSPNAELTDAAVSDAGKHK